MCIALRYQKYLGQHIHCYIIKLRESIKYNKKCLINQYTTRNKAK